jgi:hypothetical protein
MRGVRAARLSDLPGKSRASAREVHFAFVNQKINSENNMAQFDLFGKSNCAMNFRRR